VNAQQPFGLQQSQLLGDGIPPIAAVGYVSGVPEALHQHHPGLRDADRIPAGLARLTGEPVAGQRRNHQMKRIRRVGSMRRRVGERTDDLELLDGRARPPVGHDERQRILMLGPHVDEVDVHPVDLGDEVRQGGEVLLELAPVVIGGPIGSQRLDRLQLHALRGIGLPVGPARRDDAPAQVGELLLRHLDRKWTNVLRGSCLGRGGGLHQSLLTVK